MKILPVDIAHAECVGRDTAQVPRPDADRWGMNASVLVGLTLFISSAVANADPLFRYQVRAPDNEIRTFFVPSTETDFKLRGMEKARWSCTMVKRDKTDLFGIMITPFILTCRYGKGSAGIADGISCQDVGHLTREIHLLDGDKNYVISMECGIPRD